MSDAIKDDILKFLADRAPNWVRKEIIKNRLDKYDDEEIESTLGEMVKEKKIIQPPALHGTSTVSQGYALPSYENIPIRRTIKVGNTEVHRVLQSDYIQTSLEDINEAVERLSEYSNSLEDRFQELFKEETKKYWGSIITLFGIFVAVFSLINVALPRLNMPAGQGFWAILWNNTAQVLPVAVILAIFIFVLAKLFR
jgi:tetrahydromethanopterin S-methyltransferase subunit G